MGWQTQGQRRRESGAILIIVMMVMLGLLGLGITALWLTGGNIQVGTAMNQRMAALYAAEAGVEHARSILNSTNPIPNFNALLNGSLVPGGNAELNSLPVSWVQASGMPSLGVADNTPAIGALMVEPGVPGLTNTPLLNRPFPPASAGRTGMDSAGNPTAAIMGTYTVWIRNDTAEIRQANRADPADTHYMTDANSSVVVRSRGLAADGRTNVILEVALGATPGTPGLPGGGGAPPPVLCNAGKNSCDDNNSVITGIVAN